MNISIIRHRFGFCFRCPTSLLSKHLWDIRQRHPNHQPAKRWGFAAFATFRPTKIRKRDLGPTLETPIFLLNFFRCFCKLVLVSGINLWFLWSLDGEWPILQIFWKPSSCFCNRACVVSYVGWTRHPSENHLKSHGWPTKTRRLWGQKLEHDDSDRFFSSVFLFFFFRNGRVVKETRSPFEKWTLVAFPRWQWGLGFWRSTIGSCRGGRGDSRSHCGDRKVGPLRSL